MLFKQLEKRLDQCLGVAAAADETEHLLDRFVLFFEQFSGESDLGQYLARADEGVDLLQQRDGDDELFVGGDEALQLFTGEAFIPDQVEIAVFPSRR